MKVISIIDRFVFFGDFNKIITDEIPTLVKMFDGYKMNQRQESTPQGATPVTSFSNRNYAVSFREGRMDVEYANNPNTDEIGALDYALSEFSKVHEVFPKLIGNRISYIGTSFIPNQNNEPLMDLIENLNLTAIFGKSNEFNFRLNSPVKLGREECNAVITIQQGTVQGAGNKNIPAIISVNDINTMPQDKTNRFDLNQLEGLYKRMMQKSVEKNEKILALIENAEMAS